MVNIALDRINKIEEHLKKTADSILSATLEDRLKGVLFLTFIDSLSSTLYGGEAKGNQRHKFTELIQNHGYWGGADKICPVHLYRFCEIHNNKKELNCLREYLNQMLERWHNRNGEFIFIDETPDKNDIVHLWPNKGRDKIDGKRLEHFTHKHLLYGLRNSLIHQHYAKRSMCCLKVEYENVHYMNINVYVEEKIKVELIHPVGFLHSLCCRLVMSVMNDFRDRDEKPWCNGHFSEYLIDGL